MTQSSEALIEATKTFVKETLSDAEGGHDWFHTQRVYRLALRLAKEEKADEMVVQLAALLHDIADAKFHNGDETLGPKIAARFLAEKQVDEPTITHVCDIIRYMSFKNSLDGKSPLDSKELCIVQDADRLDAIGAIGIARTFNYGGFKNRSMYDPDVPPNLNMSKAEYKKSNAPTINHFYEKLLLLKDQMHTQTAKRIAEKRHDYMLSFLDQFYAEWNSKD
ncbi:MAG: HD domain-containing protein [Bacteroidota bacterium]